MRIMGIEPISSVWKTDNLPLIDIREKDLNCLQIEFYLRKVRALKKNVLDNVQRGKPQGKCTESIYFICKVK